MKMILSETEILELQENLKRRGECFKEGMLLLADVLKNTELEEFVANKKTSQFINNDAGIIDCIDKLYEEYASKLDDITALEAGKNNLSDLLSKYTQLLQANTSLKNPFQSLCEAERYSVWKNGRKDINTVVKSSQFEVTGMGVKSSQLEITQQEIPFHDPDLLAKEYKKINDKIPPRWFKWLTLWQQDFIRTNQATLLENSIPSSLRSVPGLANLSKHICSINGVESLAYFRHATPRPVDLMNNKDAYDEEYRITCLNMASQIRLSLDDQFKRAGTKQSREAVILTQSLLSPGTAADLKSKISGPSDNDTEIYKMKEEIVELFQYAFLHPTKSIDKKHTRLKALFFDETRVNQPISYRNFLAKWSLETQSDGLFKYRNYQPLKITLISTNHPFNILRRGGAYSQQTTKNEKNTTLLLGAVGRYLSSIFSEKASESGHSRQPYNSYNQLLRTLSCCEEEKSVSEKNKLDLAKTLDILLGIRHKFDENTQRLFCALQMLLSTPLDQGGLIDEDVCHNQLMISSAEAIILNCLQGSLWVACKSGKDRTGIASAAYDATLLYYNQHKKLPGCKDEQTDRKAYISLLEKLFHSGHQQKTAGGNAPGAEGIVEPGMILPADVKLGEDSNELNTFFARLNKPSDPDGGKMMASLSSLKNLTKGLFFKPVKELIAEIESPKPKKSGVRLVS